MGVVLISAFFPERMKQCLPVYGWNLLPEGMPTFHHSHVCVKVKSVVLINCGGCLNVMEFLQPEATLQIRFFIIDSHRPIALDNIYVEDQVMLVFREGDKLDAPEYDSIYSHDMVRVLWLEVIMDRGCYG